MFEEFLCLVQPTELVSEVEEALGRIIVLRGEGPTRDGLRGRTGTFFLAGVVLILTRGETTNLELSGRVDGKTEWRGGEILSKQIGRAHV